MNIENLSNYFLGRLLIIATIPIWVPGLLVLLVLYIIAACLALVIITPIYWIYTGESFPETELGKFFKL